MKTIAVIIQIVLILLTSSAICPLFAQTEENKESSFTILLTSEESPSLHLANGIADRIYDREAYHSLFTAKVNLILEQ